MSHPLPVRLPEVETELLGSLNPEQRLAAETIDRHLVIEAGAGAGKTSVLTRHFVWLLLAGAQPATIDQLLLVTFTRKAAAEMQQRVRSLLQQIAARPDLAGERARTALTMFERAWIGTFDSLCGRLLREYALVGDLDPGFSIIEEHGAGQLQRQVLEQLIARWETDSTLGQGFGSVYAECAWYQSADHANLSEFTEAFCALYESIRLGTLGTFDPELLVRPIGEGVAAYLEDVRREFDACRGNPPKGGTSLAFLEGCEAHLPQILAASDARDWEAVCQGLSDHIAPLSFGGGGSKEIKELKALLTKTRIGTELNPLIADQAAAHVIPHLATLLIRFHQAYTEAKQQLAGLDFLDLNLRLYELLRDPAHAWLVTRLRGRFRHVMVDEFQDTNRPQCALLEALGDLPVREGGGPTASTLCVVGDPKQSIYAWRSAELQEYLRFRDASLGADSEATGQAPLLVRLTTNYRSRQEVLDFSNSLLPFLQDGDKGVDVNLFGPESALQAGTEFPPADTGSLSLLAPYFEEQSDLARSREDHAAWLLGLQLRHLVDAGTLVRARIPGTHRYDSVPLQWGHIAILVRAASAYAALERQFRTLGLPYTVLQGRGFFAATEIQDVLSVLRLLTHAGDDLTCAAVLRGPCGGLSLEGLLTLTQSQGRQSRDDHAMRRSLYLQVLAADKLPGLAPADREVCHNVRDLMHDLRAALLVRPLAEVLELLFDRTGLLLTALTQSEGLRRYANLRQLQVYATGYPVGAQDSLRQFTQAMEEFELREMRIGEASVDVPGQGAITLMTMHGAKGLEWPVVVVHSLEKTPPRDRQKWGWDPELGLGITIALPGSDTYSPTSALSQLKKTRKRQEAEERLRLLYVAITRAEDRLLLTGMIRPPSKRSATDGPRLDGWLGGVYKWGNAQPMRSEALRRDGQIIPIMSQDRVAVDSLDLRELESPQVALPLPDSWADRIASLELPLPLSDRLPSQINVTALAEFDRCPAKYRFDQRGHLPGARALAVDRSVSSAAGLGQALHLLLARWIAQPATLSDPSIYPLALLETGVAPTEEVIASLNALVTAYCAHELLATQTRAAHRCFAELPLSWWLAMPGGSNGSRIYLQGKPDLLLETSPGHWSIVDYKTHSPRSDRPTLTPEIQLQLTGYALGVSQWQRVPIEQVECLILARNESGDIVSTPSPLTIGAFDKALRSFVDAHQATGLEASPVYLPGESCRQCDYRQICPEWQAAQNH